MAKLNVFISHSRKDKAELDDLVIHLGVLQQAELIDIWVDNQIAAGDDWVHEIDRAIERSKIAILLITKNFLASEHILQTEVAHLLDRHGQKELALFPVIAKQCGWHNLKWLERMKVRPKHEEPVWREAGLHADDELAEIVEEIAVIAKRSDYSQAATNGSDYQMPGNYLMGVDKWRFNALSQPTQRGIEMNYEQALDSLKSQLEQTNRYNEFMVLEARLHENLQDEYLFGPNDNNRSERIRVINNLNKLALETLKLTFNDLALGRISEAGQASTQGFSLVRQLNVTLTPDNIVPPVQTRLQDLPFNELSWEQFEALCAALVEAQPITIDCHLYGVQGDEQQGIDIVTTQKGVEGAETWAYQCKRYKEYTAGKLKNALEKMTYQADYHVLMLSIPATAAVRKVSDDQPNIFLWDARDIARKLKNYPAIVEDFFGKAWREAFCMEDKHAFTTRT